MQLNFTRKPYWHFILIGTLLYGGQQLTSSDPIQTVRGPSAERIIEMREDWVQRVGSDPSPEQVSKFIQTEIDNEILYLEAFKREFYLTDGVIRTRLIRDMRFLDEESEANGDELVEMAIGMNMHENDLVIRGLMIQLMQETAFNDLDELAPTEDELQALYKKHADEFKTDPLVGFNHIFVSNKLNEHPLEKAKKILEQYTSAPDTASLDDSDKYLHGLKFKVSDHRLLERKFGSNFSKQLMEMAPSKYDSGQWLGPISSDYGEHLVLINSYRSSKLKPLNTVRDQLVTYYRREKEQAALTLLLADLREQYEVQS